MDAIRRNPLFVAHQTTTRLQSLSQRLSRAQLVVLTGVEVHAPSDAPGQWGALHNLAASKADQGVWAQNLGRAADRIDVAESVLAEASNLFKAAWERAIQFSSDPLPTEGRVAAAGEIETLREALLALANTRIGERALFAGDATDGTAFDASGAYTGAAATGHVQIGPDETVAATLDGASIFQGGVDVFAALEDLSAALAADDADAVAATLDALSAGHTQLVTAREIVGFDQARVHDAQLAVSEMEALLDERLSDAVVADPATAYTELVSLQTSYQAALQVIATSSGARLFDFLR